MSATYLKGVQNVVLGRTVDAIYDRLKACIESIQSNGEQAWTRIDDSPQSHYSTYSGIWHSVGDRSLGSGDNKGDTDLFFEAYISSGTPYRDIWFATYQDYSPTSGTGFRRAGPSSAGYSWQALCYWANSFDWTFYGDEYEFIFMFNLEGTIYYVHSGCGKRVVPGLAAGVGRSTSQSGTGDGVVFGLDRDISSDILPGQDVWLVNQTPDGAALQSVAPEQVTVVAVDDSSITVNGVSGTFADGSLIGWDPAPNFVRTQYANGIPIYWPTLLTLAAGGTTMHGSLQHGGEAYNENWMDPLYSMIYPLFPLYLEDTSLYSPRVQTKLKIVPSGGQGENQLQIEGSTNYAILGTYPANSAYKWAIPVG
jgi:hypothetical protein